MIGGGMTQEHPREIQIDALMDVFHRQPGTHPGQPLQPDLLVGGQ